MFEYMVLILAGVVLFSIIGMYDLVTKKGKRAMARLLVASASFFFALCVLGSYFDVSNSTTLPGSCEVLSSTVLSNERTRYQLRSLSDSKVMFSRTFKENNFPPSGYDLVSIEGRKLLLPKD